MTGTEEDALALKILADVINQKQDELINLQASYAKLGGIFDGDEDEAPKGKQKLLTGPKSKPARKKRKKGSRVSQDTTGSFKINGVTIPLSERHQNILELVHGGGGAPVSKDDLAGCFGSATPNWFATVTAINNKLAAANVKMVIVRGQGYKPEKLPA